MRAKGCSKIQNNKLNTYDWLCGVPDAENATDFVEVQFKNTRKGYYLNQAHIPLEKGDMVAVEATPGHDIGMVTLAPDEKEQCPDRPGTEKDLSESTSG